MVFKGLDSGFDKVSSFSVVSMTQLVFGIAATGVSRSSKVLFWG